MGELWASNPDAFSKLKHSLNEAALLIEKLNLDDEIKVFLTNMNNGRANISDLNHKVMAWIRESALETKIKLTFNLK